MGQNIALLVIDVQEGLTPGSYRESEVLSAINVVIAEVRRSGGDVIFVQHCHSSYAPLMKGHSGWQIHHNLDREPLDRCIEKQASDAFYQTDLDMYLRERKIDRLLVTGLQTEYCVDTTCRSALSHGFDVTLISDAHTTGGTTLPVATVIAHHNELLANLAHPNHTLDVVSSAELRI